MKKSILTFLSIAFSIACTTSCIQEFDPMEGTVSKDQASNAPNSYNNFVNSITSSLIGEPKFGVSDFPFDYGYSSFFQMRDVMGQDMAINYLGHWYSTWYESGTALGPQYLLCQVPWTYYYSWIKNCNTVLSLAGEEPDEEKKHGAGIAYAMRAMFYMDLARMYSNKTYALDKEAETVPIVTEKTAITDLAKNPRVSNEKMWNFIIEDLNNAEKYLADYERTDIYTPNISVVYGLKARAYLVMEDWPNAEKYAKLAQTGFTMMDESLYTDRETGFNTPNGSWMFGIKFKDTDKCIVLNDADSSWGSFMFLEANHECGYAANYGHLFLIDRHLYETIPSTDFRKKCFIDFGIDQLGSKEEVIAELGKYTDYPESVYRTGQNNSAKTLGGVSLKFRVGGGEEGHNNQYVGYLVSVPLMRVEEMYLIEAEAAGMQDEGRGITLLTNFAKTRDASFVYGKHTDTYGNTQTPQFRNEVWWQRRVEFWGEGMATFDIKRLNKGIIRSYPNSNHIEGRRWNTTTPPDWMNLCIVQSETNYNSACTNNPTPIPPTSDSDIFNW